MSTLELKVYDIFKSRFSEQEAATVIEYFEVKADEKFLQRKDIMATKTDIYESKVEIIRWMFGVFTVLMIAIIGLYIKK
ncbi:MAG: hypothetical protein WCP65_07870 [Bacteroidota bacterium]